MNQLSSYHPAAPLALATSLLAAALLLAAATPAPAAAAIPRPEKAKLALQSDHTTYDPGATVRISALVAIEAGWHVNSHTPTFDYLIPTVLELELPAGWSQPEVEYPPAQKKTFAFADAPLSVYDGDVVIQARLKIPAGARPGAVPIRARLNYQACDHSQCLPPVVSSSQLTLTVRAAARRDGAGRGTSAAVESPGGPPPLAAATVPGHVPAGSLTAGRVPPGPRRDRRDATTTAAPGVAGAGAEARGALATGAPATGESRASAAPTGAPSTGTSVASGPATGAPPTGTVAPRAAAGAPPTGTSVGPRPATGAPPTGNSVAPRPAPGAAGAGAQAASVSRSAPSAGGLAGMLLLALLGGLILNAMPCVLPIVSLKVFGLVRSASHGRHEVVRGALAAAAGILVSFWALAALAIAAASAGAAVGWGIQFQRPGFVAFLAVVVTLFCLNLWGLFEIPLPRALARLGGAGAREGLAGHFVSGLFATLMATPCSAPFLGTAIGFALTQPAPVVLAIFTAVGAGLALPYLTLAAAPGAARLLPRPGAWMETLRGVMGFLLAASAVWLLYVLAAQVSPERVALFEAGLLLIALVTWLRHRAPAGRLAARAVTGASLVAVAAAAVALAATGAGAGSAATASRAGAPGKPSGPIAWVAFDRGRAESLAAGGQLVFVDVTADWCFTCKVNERLILDTPEVATAFAAHNVLPMRADWTNRNDEITRFLADHGRYGIPFYLLYRPGREPYVFSELPSKSAILAVLEAASAAKPAATQARKL
jgi:thiol:disulfide interchange protein